MLSSHDYVLLVLRWLLDGTPVRYPGPTLGVDLWWSGKHDNHGGNIQVITVPDGWTPKPLP